MSVGNHEIVDLGQCVSRLVRQGLPLASGLMALRRDLPAGRLRRSLGAVVQRLDAGLPIETALAHDARLPGALHGLMLASLRSGALDEILDALLQQQRRLADYRRQILLALAYPTILLGALAAVVAFVCAVVVPQLYGEWDAESLANLLNLRDAGMGWPTRFLLGIAFALRECTAWVVAAVALLAAAGWLGLRVFGPTAFPLIGPIWRHAQRAELVRLLSLFVRHEVPLPQALQLLAQDLGDRNLRARAEAAAGELAAGGSTTQALARLATPATQQVVAWIHDHRSLADGLEMLAATAETDAAAHLEMVRALLTPAAFLVVVLTVLLILAGLFGPLLQSLEGLGASV